MLFLIFSGVVIMNFVCPNTDFNLSLKDDNSKYIYIMIFGKNRNEENKVGPNSKK